MFNKTNFIAQLTKWYKRISLAVLLAHDLTMRISNGYKSQKKIIVRLIEMITSGVMFNVAKKKVY